MQQYNEFNKLIKQSEYYTIFMSSENCRASDPHRLLLNLLDKINLKRSDKYIALSNLGIYYTWKDIKVIQNNKFKISALT